MSIPERPAQLLLLQDSLIKLKDYEVCEPLRLCLLYQGFAVESIVVTIPLPVTELGMRPMFLFDIIAHNHLVNFIR